MRKKSTVKNMPLGFVFYCSCHVSNQYSVSNISSEQIVPWKSLPGLRMVHREFHNLSSTHLKWAIQL